MKTQQPQQTHAQIIEELSARTATIEYILAQTLTIALRDSKNPELTLRDMQTYYAEKMAKHGITADSGNKGFECAERIFTTAKANL